MQSSSINPALTGLEKCWILKYSVVSKKYLLWPNFLQVTFCYFAVPENVYISVVFISSYKNLAILIPNAQSLASEHIVVNYWYSIVSICQTIRISRVSASRLKKLYFLYYHHYFMPSFPISLLYWLLYAKTNCTNQFGNLI